MRTRVVLLVLAAAIVLAGPAAAQLPKSAIVNSPHDIRSNKTQGDVCAGCHTPHTANVNAKALLWNRKYVPLSTDFTSLYTTAVNPDFKGGTSTLGAGSASSLLCMSCHDGTATTASMPTVGNTAVFELDGRTTLNSTGTTAASTTILSKDLSNDHPVGFVYSNSQTDVTLVGKLKANPDPTKVRLFAGRVECGTCHDAHNNSLTRFLRSTNDNSVMCLECHQ
jgi:predicted CXXCH cytochrome family protein